ncbi:MAG: Mov34/MPN/PAD-1 family protein [Phycisphaeraceae bacterium]
MLRFTPTAWAKLHYLCHYGDTEIGGFGLTAADDPLLITEFLTLKQEVTSVSVDFDDEAVADLFEAQVDRGIPPERFARIWCHTHPGHSASPSGTDEQTFARVFGRCDWAVMFILAREGETYARLRFNVGPGGQVLIPVEVDYTQPFEGADHDAWEAEYEAHVQPVAETFGAFGADAFDALDEFDDPDAWSLDALNEAEAVGDLDDLEQLLEHETEI